MTIPYIPGSHSLYIQNGYPNRQAYLESLSQQFEVDLDSVEALAHLLGPREDFDGLVSELEDFSQFL